MAVVDQPVSVSAAEPRIVLRGVAWPLYEALRDGPANRGVRMTYDRGDLEMMSPSRPHEHAGYLLGQLIDVWTDERDLDATPLRTLTLRREDLQRGLEPDNCYYVQNDARVWDKPTLDFRVDPPPDLAVEIDLVRTSLDKMEIYAALGVPELWRYDGESLQAFVLVEGRYAPTAASRCFPGFPLERAADALRRIHVVRNRALVREFRRFVREL